MQINYHDVKEISLVSSIEDYDKKYTDLLRVSKSWISYKRSDANGDEKIWSYKTASDFMPKFESLIDSMYHEYHASHNCSIDDSYYKFNIRITFKDNTHVNISRNGNFYQNGLYHHAKCFIDMIPKGYDYSKVLEIPILKVFKDKLTLKTLDNKNMNNVLALMWAEPGAMGEPGLVQLLTTSYELLSVNVVYDSIVDVDYDIIFSKIFGEHLDKIIRQHGILKEIIVNEQEWFYSSLGMGNHLYLRGDFLREVGNDLFDVAAPYRYTNWNKIIGN